ncbi:MAG: pyruvate, phosphate dikinase [Pseudomonadota bacterium]|nr:pyruvate, phosphate dikinase [Pseudomonadota bacterium]
MTQWLKTFGGGSAEGSADMRDLLGGKGANLAEMANLGLPVPPGFTVTTELCTAYYAGGKCFPDSLSAEIDAGMRHIEETAGARFGEPDNPLLVSVRSGSRASMPGMMDTVLNLGLNDATAAGLADRTGDARFAYDSYRRFIQMYGDVVLGVGHHEFEDLLDRAKDEHSISLDTDMTAEDWQSLIREYKDLVKARLDAPFPEDGREQLWGAVRAVFDSWMNERAMTYRRIYDIPESWGTAVNVQAMVFGNMGEDCATGVAFTRDPSSGDKRIYGEYLINAQGEDVVSGIRTPRLLAVPNGEGGGDNALALETAMPEVFAELRCVSGRLESHYRDMQDIEFTVQKGKLWMLQTRAGKRTAAAALKIAVDMVAEGVLDEETAVLRIEPETLEQLLHPRLDPDAPRNVLTRGLPASPGAAAGKVVFSSEHAEDLAAKGEAVVLVRPETSPDDIHGMHAARAILTSRGGMTSHAAVVARGMGRPCITGATALRIDLAGLSFSVGGVTVQEGDLITVDGSRGEALEGEISTIEPEMSGDFATVMGWADNIRAMAVRANAETPTDAAMARKFGAEGIGLCRTEHMFFDAMRIITMREMILADDSTGRRAALAKLLPMQRQDFVELFRIMAGLPVTIRLLDPPLHEFLPHGEAEIREVAEAAGISFEEVNGRVAQLRENNPMLGHRGCRLGISHPEIYEMQVRAIFEAAIEAGQADSGQSAVLEIMIPLVMGAPELKILKNLVDGVVAEIAAGGGGAVPDYVLGTMIELPRAALRAGDIAEMAEFFSFGTNDLTQTTLGISRDDAASFMDSYVRQGMFAQDPFASLDLEGVGELIETACARGRAARADLKLGICGEHGGDPASIHFFAKCGLDYVSCSPYRVPIARLAAAQAKLSQG